MTTLSFGDRSQSVRMLQKSLNAHGATLLVDGDYGDATEAAVRAYQLSVGLVADGIAGSKTLQSLAGGNCDELLKNADLMRAAQLLEVPLASIYAVNEVESRGNGFLDNGRPVILFERHIMYRQLATPRQATDDAEQLKHHADQLAAANPAIVNPKPGGYAGGSAEHQRLSQARLIDDVAALESTSWGAFQIMGMHWQRLGYANVHAFVDDMKVSEALQLGALVRFIQTDPVLHKALKARKWAMFARLFNGPAYQRNLYDIKLLRAYERHADCACGQAEAA
jgi:peptidoglycan hydrolase-like protein with peptidoglycan-binding domain